MPAVKWTSEKIKEGIERFIALNQRFPTARDYDATPYLPTSRQVQRAFGGMARLRQLLGYNELDYTKGKLRSKIASSAGTRGIEAEDALELLLIQRFGEPFVHSQKRYIKAGKSRYDFFIYAKNVSFGIDIFATDRKEYISTNVRHKLTKYSKVNPSIPIYFVLAGAEYSNEDIAYASKATPQLKAHPNITLLCIADLLKELDTFTPLDMPHGVKSILV